MNNVENIENSHELSRNNLPTYTITEDKLLFKALNIPWSDITDCKLKTIPWLPVWMVITFIVMCILMPPLLIFVLILCLYLEGKETIILKIYSHKSVIASHSSTTACALSKMLNSYKKNGDVEWYYENLQKKILDNCLYGSNFLKEESIKLRKAAINGDVTVLKALLQLGAAPNTKDHEGCTPLHLVGDAKAAECAKLLIAHGADINIQDADRRLPILLAAQSGQIGVIEVLVNNGQDINIPSGQLGHTPLHAALSYGQSACAQFLLERGANMQPKNHTHAIFCASNVECIKLLLDRGVDVNTPTDSGCTPLHLMTGFELSNHKLSFEERLACCQYLLERGADVNALTNEQYRVAGVTPLHRAVEETKEDKDSRIVQLLLDYGANINAKDANGKTPLYYLKGDKENPLYNLLKSQGARGEMDFMDRLRYALD